MPDTSFGGGTGVVTVNLGDNEYGRSVAIQSDGKLVVVGLTSQDSLVARFQPDGALDTGFGSGGIVIRSFSAGSSDNFVDIALQLDGKIVAVGSAVPSGKSTPAFIIASYLRDSDSLGASTASVSALSPQTASVGLNTSLAASGDHDLTQLATGILLSASKRRGVRAWAPLPRPLHRAQG